MASIVEVKNPLTGAVERADKLDHTAQEIDDAVGRALSSGLGTSCVPIGTQSLDAITSNGWYQFSADNTTAPVQAGELFVLKRTSAGYCSQVIFNAASLVPSLLVRQQAEGAWSPWEWVNPPMKLGEEYRTTERYLGKPVYVKAIDFGAAPNSTLKAVSIGTANIEKIVDFKWMYAKGNDIGMIITNPNFTLIAANTGNVVIETNADMSSIMIKAVVKYIKTTD